MISPADAAATPPGRTPAALLLHQAEQRPEAPFVTDVSDRVILSYGSLAGHASRVASILRKQGVGPGDRVILAAQNSWRWVAAFFGAMMSGGLVVPVNTRFAAGDLGRVVADAHPAAVIGDPPLLRLLDRGFDRATRSIDDMLPGPRAPGAAAEDHSEHAEASVIAYTSGSTGAPKGVVLSPNAVAGSGEIMASVFHSHPGTRTAVMVPLFHNTGFVDGVVHMAAVGGHLEIHRRFSASALADGLLSRRLSFFVGVPTMYVRLLEVLNDVATGPDPWLGYGGAGMTRATIERLRRVLPGARLTNLYGLSEATSLTHFLPWLLAERDPEAVGIPAPGTLDHLDDPHGSEILIRSPNVMNRYWGRPEATARKLVRGWLRTGDLGARDERGMLSILGRMDDVINRGGEKVAPFEVESALARLPGIVEACVVGLPHPDLGESVAVAYVAGPDGPDPAAVRGHLSGLVADFKVPMLAVRVPSLPRNSHGKVARREVAELLRRATT